MIQVKHLVKKFGDRIILDDVSTVFERGKTNLIIGKSGSGKTVLLKSIVGLLQADEGEIWYGDMLFNRLSTGEQRDVRKKIGMLFQKSALFDSMTVEKNVMFPLDMFTDLSLAEKREQVQMCLKRVQIENSNRLYPSELSGGGQKRVAIARAIILHPTYLFCDEPNSGLDPQTSMVIDELIHEITLEYNITTIINTHDMGSVINIGEKIIYISDSHIEWTGSKDEIIQSGNRLLDDFIFASPFTKKIRETFYRGA